MSELEQERETDEDWGDVTTPGWRRWMRRAAKRVWGAMETVGEVVSGVFGMEDSLFQDILDDMTPEDYAVAMEVKRVREAQDAKYDAELAAAAAAAADAGAAAAADARAAAADAHLPPPLPTPLPTPALLEAGGKGGVEMSEVDVVREADQV
jgi:hypothetical protein